MIADDSDAHAPAIELSGDPLSYRDLVCYSKSVARQVEAKANVACLGAQILVVLGESFELPVAVLAVQAIGAIPVLLDVERPAQDLAVTIADSNPTLMVTVESYRHLILSLAAPSTPVVYLDLTEVAANSTQFDRSRLHIPSTLHDGFVASASVPTRMPMAFPEAHASATTNSCRLHSMDTGICAGYRVVALGHDTLLVGLWMALSNGATFVLRSRRLASDLRTVHAIVCTYPELSGLGHPTAYPSLKVVVVVGDVCPSHVQTLWSAFVQFRLCRNRDLSILGCHVELVMEDALRGSEILHSRDFVDNTTLRPNPFDHATSHKNRAGKEGSREFWCAALELAAKTAPLSVPKPVACDVKYKALCRTLDLRHLRDVCNLAQVTPSSVFRTAWAMVLRHYTQSNHVMFGTVVSGRDGGLAGTERMIGTLINTVPVLVHVGQSELASDCLKAVHAFSTDMIDHAHCSLSDIQRWIGKTELFDTIVAFENYPPSQLQLSDIATPVRIDVTSGHEFVDTTVCVAISPEAGDLYQVKTTFKCADVSEEMVQRMTDRFAHILAMLATPTSCHQVVAETSAAPANEANFIALSSCGTHVALPYELLHHAFEERARECPGLSAVEYGPASLSYGDLNDQANVLAVKLTELGVHVGSRVAVIMERCLEFPIGLLATLKAGASMVPLDATFPPERLRYVLADARVSVVVTTNDHIGHVAAIEHDIPVVSITSKELAQSGACFEPRPAQVATPLDEAYVVYTSGSTGKPKGVPVQHAGAVNVMVHSAAAVGIVRHARVMQFMAVSFDGFQMDMWKCLSHGATLVLRDTGFMDTLVHSIDAFACTPTALAQLGDPLVESCGLVPLTPIQVLSFNHQWENIHFWNLSITRECCQRIEIGALRQAVEQLTSHHDMLRARFQCTNSKWTQYILKECDAGVPMVEFVAIDGVIDLESAILAREQTLHLTDGPLFRVALLETPDRSQYIHWTLHHTITDLVSWRILLGDLQLLLTKKALGPKTTSFQEWSTRLHNQAAEWDPSLWSRYLGDDLVPPANSTDFDTTHHRIHLAAAVAMNLNKANETYGTNIQELALAALTGAWSELHRVGNASKRVDLCVMLEGHGRESWDATLDVSNTVGWFTNEFPVVLSGLDNIADLVRHVKETLRAVPHHGLSYGAIKYLAPTTDRTQEIQRHRRHNLSFNYTGRFQEMDAADSMFRPVHGLDIPQKDQSEQGFSPGSVVVSHADNTLVLDLNVPAWLMPEEDIRKCGTLWCRWMDAVVTHCLDSTTVGGRTLSDLPLLQSNETIDAVETEMLTALRLRPLDVEDIYPVTPLQSGLLVALMADPAEYVLQIVLDFRGTDELSYVKQCWHNVSSNIPFLRTTFVSTSYGMFQAVAKADWSEWTMLDEQPWPASDLENCTETFLATDRRRGFPFPSKSFHRFTGVHVSGTFAVLGFPILPLCR
ncbi:hypothetical protein H310_10173 [Aphanomyces invadans]|uniref:Carrier domain-containing protein n=1 Tax=Aphanomyces invadans TaxID=157072 RepID=A0A024TSF4_9STRA|nr:hypothetical protein H310_10173 [Aphanomyces invadans]ETV96899.1 hypothetical protein H310_10173 [Aphanomyces invadans]|eukprot:XP_008874676.1 hypothetical protein H310_10173 [Aphanomyces invadans]